jgi:hypothetical protein
MAPLRYDVEDSLAIGGVQIFDGKGNEVLYSVAVDLETGDVWQHRRVESNYVVLDRDTEEIIVDVVRYPLPLEIRKRKPDLEEDERRRVVGFRWGER